MHVASNRTAINATAESGLEGYKKLETAVGCNGCLPTRALLRRTIHVQSLLEKPDSDKHSKQYRDVQRCVEMSRVHSQHRA